jgi:signal transduction histidine kinase
VQVRLLQQRARLQAQALELERLRNRQQLAGLVALVVAGLALAGYLLWRYRQREARRQQALRTRIAADLHDEVGSMLTQISMQSTLLREGGYAPAQQQAYLDQMADASRRAARQMSDAVWSIDARYDSAASLLDRLRDHAHEVLPPAGLELDFTADAGIEAAAVPLATRQALYYIYKEALHNVVKHAQARQVQVQVRLLGRALELAIRDDGRGTVAASRPGGQGLPNMRMRAQAVGGTLHLAPEGPGLGLVVRLPLG